MHKGTLYRFVSQVRIEDIDACWEWTGPKDKNGYGKCFSDLHGEDRAHRLAYVLQYGPVPEGLLVCHTCDNPGCVNPQHLWAGSTTENNADRHAKGRSTGSPGKGSKHPCHKLTEEDIPTIRLRAARGASQEEIAVDYGITASVVSRIVNRRVWKHVP